MPPPSAAQSNGLAARLVLPVDARAVSSAVSATGPFWEAEAWMKSWPVIVLVYVKLAWPEASAVIVLIRLTLGPARIWKLTGMPLTGWPPLVTVAVAV